MSTPPQYDPEKANAWTRDLPPSTFATLSSLPPSVRADLHAHLKEGGELLVELLNKHNSLEAAARAVIAAGRPHPIEPHIPPDGEWHSTKSHTCPQCAAWDALAELLKG